MGNRLIGKIIYVRKNYGFISTIVDEKNVKIFFLVKSSMLDVNGDFCLGDNVSFLTRNITVRGTNLLAAYDLKSCDEKPNVIKIISHSNDNFLYSYKLLNLLNDEFRINDDLNNGLMEHDKRVSMFFMKWILFLENKCRSLVEMIRVKVNVSTCDFINKLCNEKSTCKIIKSALKNLKDDTLFRPESDSISYKPLVNDPNDVEIVDVPVQMLMNQLSLKELVGVLKFISKEYSDMLEDDLKIVLYYSSNMLSDISFIRNKVAHGNLVVPFILDDTFSPSYFYEMASCFPQWNSNEKLNDVEEYPAFEFIRYNSRMLAKQGINLAGINGGPMIIALYFTKSLLINQAKKSFFSFAFLLMVYFSYIDDENYEQFILEMKQLGIFAIEGSDHNVFSKYPNKNSIKLRLTRIILPIFYWELNMFKVFSSLCLKVNEKIQIDSF